MRPKQIPTGELTLAIKIGFLTRRLWDEFFAEGSKSRQSKKWKGLVRSELFLPHPSPLVKDVVIPNPKNSLVKELSGHAQLGVPFMAQLEHDETMARILIRLERSKVIQSFRTELEQKRQEPDERKGASRKERRKFPDAILTIDSPKGIIEVALELELNTKSQKRYRLIFENYARKSNLKTVVFITGGRSIFRSIRKAEKEMQRMGFFSSVAYSELKPWEENPIHAPFRFDGYSSSLAKMMIEGFK